MKYLEFAKKIGLNEEQYKKIEDSFNEKFSNLEENQDKQDLINFQVLRVLKKLQLNPKVEIKSILLGIGSERENANGKFRVGYFLYNNEVYSSFLPIDLYNKYINELDKFGYYNIKCGVGDKRLFMDDLTTFKFVEEIQDIKSFITKNLSDYIEKDLNNLFNDNRNFVIIKANILSLDAFNTRAQCILMDDSLDPAKTLIMWVDIDAINFTEDAKDLIVIGNTYINSDGQCMINPIKILVPEDHKKVESQKVSEENDVSDFI